MIFPKERDNQKKLQTAEQLFQKEWMKPREVSPDSRFLFYKIFTLFGSQCIQEARQGFLSIETYNVDARRH